MYIYMCIYTCVMGILHFAHMDESCNTCVPLPRMLHACAFEITIDSCHEPCMYHLRMCHDAFRRVTGLIKYIVCVTWLVDIFDMTHSSLCYVCVTWQVDVMDTTHL